MFQHFDIENGSTLDYDATFYSTGEADVLFEHLRADTPWQQEKSRFGPFPRLTAWYADEGLTYSYSGVTHHAIPWTAALADVRRRVEQASNQSAFTPTRSRSWASIPRSHRFRSARFGSLS
jgi:hypothetical protein